jgi:hypothetical protein
MTDPMTIDEIRKASPYDLAGMVGCGLPDNRETPGFAMLASVRDSVVEAIEGGSITLTCGPMTSPRLRVWRSIRSPTGSPMPCVRRGVRGGRALCAGPG